MLLRGKEAAKGIDRETALKIEEIRGKGIIPTLAIVRVGNAPDNIAYENGAVKRAVSLGINPEKHSCPPDCTEKELTALLEELNRNRNVHGILLLRPLPPHMDDTAVRNILSPEKDIDCITDKSLGAVFTGKDGFAPCTAESCLAVLKHYGIGLWGKKAVMIGRSLVVGRPLAMMMMKENATVTICHTKTGPDDLKAYCRNADIIISAAGSAGTVTGDMVREGQTVIDVGINVDENGNMRGDVDFDPVSRIVKNITPVPGGVGAVTVSVLMRHLAQAAERAL